MTPRPEQGDDPAGDAATPLTPAELLATLEALYDAEQYAEALALADQYGEAALAQAAPEEFWELAAVLELIESGDVAISRATLDPPGSDQEEV